MKKGDLVRLTEHGSMTLGAYWDETQFGIGVFLKKDGIHVASVYWFGGCGLTRTHMDFIEKMP